MWQLSALSVVPLWLSLYICIATAVTNIIDDKYFYGQSPPVYPSPNTTGLGGWADAVQKARLFVSQLTLEEKSNLTCGAAIPNGCNGYVAPISRLGFEGLCLQDGAHGIRNTELVNSYPSEIHVGAR